MSLHFYNVSDGTGNWNQCSEKYNILVSAPERLTVAVWHVVSGKDEIVFKFRR